MGEIEYYKILTLEPIHYVDDEGNSCIERWLPIQGYEGLYEVSDLGRVKGLLRVDGKDAIIMERIMAGGYSKNDYRRVSLRGNKSHKSKNVHRLVATAFIPNPENKPQVNHKNGIKTDNRATQLEWVTNSENAIHAHRTGLNTMNGDGHHKNKVTKNDVFNILKSIEPQSVLAKRYGISQSVISAIKNGNIWKNHTGLFPKRKRRGLLSKDTVVSIFNDIANDGEIAKKYGLCKSVINNIKTGRTWSKVTGKEFKKHILSEEKVIAIFVHDGSYKNISKIFNVSYGIVRDIKIGATWGKLTSKINTHGHNS